MLIRKRIVRIALACAGASVLLVLGGRALIAGAAKGRTYSDVNRIPHRRVGLVLGCAKRLGGRWENPFFDKRIQAAAQLFRAGKVDYLLVSGDNHTRTYDESTDMKDSLVRAGVPADRVYCDFAGFRTLDSIVRAKEIFGQTQITIVSQEFHNQRAIFLARTHGMDAIGFNAAEVDLRYSFDILCREEFARAGALLDVYVFRNQPKFLGPKIPIGG